MQRFADKVLAQDGAQCGTSVSTAGELGWAGSFEVDVAEGAVWTTDFPKEHGPSVTELGDEVSELVSCIGLGDGP